MAQNFSGEVETIVNALLQVSDRVMEVSKDHVITKAWDSHLSAPRDSDQFIGKKVSEINNDRVYKQCDELVARSFALRENNCIEYTTTEDKKPVTYSMRILAIHPDKDFLFVVTKNVSVKEGVEIVEDKWRLALDAAGDGMWDLNMQTGKIFFSPKWHDIFGYNPAEISTWDEWVSKIHPDDKNNYKLTVADHVAGRVPSYSVEQRFLCKDGTYKWILSRGVIISRTSDGNPLRAIGTHHDIQEQKQAEQSLKTSRETFANAFDHSGIGIALINPDGRWLDVNHVICQMTGYTKEELMQMNHYDVTYPDDREIDRGLIDQMLEKEIYMYTIEKRYVSKQQKIVLGLLTVSLVWNHDHTPKFFITQVLDITKKKELENEVKKKNSELEAAKVNLTYKVNELEALNNIIANNLKAPADNIRMITEAILNKNVGGRDPNKAPEPVRHNESLELIRQNCASIQEALDSLKVSAGI